MLINLCRLSCEKTNVWATYSTGFDAVKGFIKKFTIICLIKICCLLKI